MRFWDSSALLPLVLEEPLRGMVLGLLDQDDRVVIWWGTSMECHSAIQRRFREGALSLEQLQRVRSDLRMLLSAVAQVEPTEPVRSLAHRLLAIYPLRAADALQLAAALTWAENRPDGRELVSLDERLRLCGLQEGFTVLP